MAYGENFPGTKLTKSLWDLGTREIGEAEQGQLKSRKKKTCLILKFHIP